MDYNYYFHEQERRIALYVLNNVGDRRETK